MNKKRASTILKLAIGLTIVILVSLIAIVLWTEKPEEPKSSIILNDGQVTDSILIDEKLTSLESNQSKETDEGTDSESNNQETLQEYRPWMVTVDSIDYKLRNYSEDSPLLHYTELIAQSCWETGMSWESFCLIAIHESSAGLSAATYPYNAWGWLSEAGKNWTSWEESIPQFCNQFVKLYGMGLNETNHFIYDPKGSYYIYFG